jgi:hypothetical protein
MAVVFGCFQLLKAAIPVLHLVPLRSNGNGSHPSQRATSGRTGPWLEHQPGSAALHLMIPQPCITTTGPPEILHAEK